MEKENRLLGGCALLTCLTIPLTLCAVAFVFGFGANLPSLTANFAAPTAGAVERLAMIGPDGNVYVMDRNGESKVMLTNDAKLDRQAPVRRLYAFPNWSPNNERVAFVGVTSESDGKAFLYSASARDGKPLEIFSSADMFPFYLSWSPDSKRIAFLAQNQDEMTLNYANVDGSVKQVLDKGSPLYFSWSPDSSALLSHVGGSRRQSADAFIGLHSIAKGGPPQHLSIAPANFLAPSWSPDGKELLMALMGASGSSDTLIVTDMQGEQARTLARFSGTADFNWSPDGKQIAYMITQRAAGGLKSELHVIKADSRDDQTLTDESPLAFFWSPDNLKIAYLVRARGDQGTLQFTDDPAQPGPLRMTWKVVTLADKKITTLSTFTPTDAFASLLPYFDQYAQSLRLWSPDSQTLVYSADERDDAEAIYLVSVSGAEEARRIATGSIAVWSWH